MVETIDSTDLLCDLMERISARVAEQPETPAYDIARGLMPEFTPEGLRSLAFGFVHEYAANVQRARVRQIETAAFMERCASSRERERQQLAEEAKERQRQWVEGAAERKQQRLRQMQATYAAPYDLQAQRDLQELIGEDFPAWYERGRELAAERGEDALEDFEASWFIGGWNAYHDAKMRVELHGIIKDYSRRLRLQITHELLTSLFALGDGSEPVTWGEATVEQHEKRIELLTGNAAGNVETAARHLAAIRMIQEAGASCLRDLAGEPVCA